MRDLQQEAEGFTVSGSENLLHMKVSAFSVETSDADSGFRPVPETDFPPQMETKEDNHGRGIDWDEPPHTTDD